MAKQGKIAAALTRAAIAVDHKAALIPQGPAVVRCLTRTTCFALIGADRCAAFSRAAAVAIDVRNAGDSGQILARLVARPRRVSRRPGARRMQCANRRTAKARFSRPLVLRRLPARPSTEMQLPVMRLRSPLMPSVILGIRNIGEWLAAPRPYISTGIKVAVDTPFAAEIGMRRG